ncbi:MuF-C-terminal domain-containing protein [Porphyromonas levii]|uniref:Phage MuF C-terminal domain-containing protein n=1 Tax=Porphyromonas levii TaxID=28114 RepID=A0A4Y8WMP5_9PORP|nr:hypothetical protein [Porphyromonas levii]TFH94380.1 hypothetical protein E4P47_07720 [Porphyromonas levii]TFH95979.1 hypothetical protein E4P48_06180 [Porphyromonas levii]
MANYPMVLYGNKLIKKIKKHGYSILDLLNLPKSLAYPIAVFDTKGDGSRIALAEIKDHKGNNFVVSVRYGNGTQAEVNVITSVYGKLFESVVRWLRKGYLTYADKKKALAYLSGTPAPIAGALTEAELSHATKVVKDFQNQKIVEDNDIRYREFEAVNNQFNTELQQQIEGTLPKGHIYKLGIPNHILRSAGIPMLPIEMSASRASAKSKQDNHPFNLELLRDLPRLLNNPLAIFSYGDKTKAQNIIVEAQYDGKELLVGLHLSKQKGYIEVNDVRGLFPKDTYQWLNWIAQGKAIYLDKESIQEKMNQRRINLAEVAHLDLDAITKIVKDFQNPAEPYGKFQIGDNTQTKTLDEKQRKNGSQEVITHEDDLRYRLSKKDRSVVEGWLRKRNDLTEEEIAAFIEYTTPFDNKTALAMGRWFANGTIRLPEDQEMVIQAIKVSEIAKVDPLRYSSPIQLINTHSDKYSPKTRQLKKC